MATGVERSPAESERPDSRLRLGLEQTLLAWVRTGLALMGFGFVLARFGLFLEQFEQAQQVHKHGSKPVHISLVFGVVLILLGVAVNVISAWMHRPYLVRFRQGETDLPATWKLGMALAALSAVVGVAMAILLLVTEDATAH
jgi:putative membrane protein